ncbi:hypothetical protein [Paenibacillus lentus]|uniref:Adhesin domain-containing protein n=1 Tax=Paenibacillus lentus TaxID=1338368 RepID=A0A3Q8SDU1_9BACL|nr:hypothetical protein [Paenibacillus lentus]AZK48375.1 hypothetical protein EIM92_21180 [Paenibacillus lentus]
MWINSDEKCAYDREIIEQTTTGNVSVHIANMNKESLLNVKTEVGNIELNLDDAIQCRFVTKSEVGGIVGASEGTSKINGGGGEVTLQSEIGMIVGSSVD